MKLKWQLILLLLFLLLVPSAILSYLSYTKSVKQIQQHREHSRAIITNQASQHIYDYLYQTIEYVRVDSNIPQLHYFLEKTQQDYSRKDILEILRSVIVKDPLNVTSAAIIDLNGLNVLDTNVTSEATSEADLPYFIQQQSNELPQVYFNYNQPSIPRGLTVSSPIRNGFGDTVGYLRLKIEAAVIQQLINQFTKDIKQTYRIQVVEADTVIADSHLAFKNQLHQFATSPYLAKQEIQFLNWQVTLQESFDSIMHPIDVQKNYFLYQLSASFVLAVLISFIVAHFLSLPVQRVKRASLKIAHGAYDHRLKPETTKEFDELAKAINTMADQLVLSYRTLEQEHEELIFNQNKVNELNEQLEHRVKERTFELEQKHLELESAMTKIIQSEKMASLGSLVAGVSHELNTPIGIAITSSSYALDKINEINEQLNSKLLSQNSLIDLLGDSEKALTMAISNCHKASELVTSFKHVSVDQTSNRRREFNLGDTLIEIERTLHNMIKQNHHHFELIINDPIALDGYPGAFEQIMMNLITNSIKHGFDGTSHGTIKVTVFTPQNDKVELLYQDDGIGIERKSQNKVFDPFYTSKMGEGGSGLGLYIVYNLVTNVLGGSIELTSTPKQGVNFKLTLPLSAP